MANQSYNTRNKKKINGIINLKIVAKKVQKIMMKKLSNSSSGECEEEEVRDSNYVPKDVKEGHFAVIAVDNEKPKSYKRFVVPLSYLAHPLFLRLLEQAEEEYGFDHEGALTIPCRPAVLERILAQGTEQSGNNVDRNWGSCKINMAQIY